jgi:signal transduction histidine kinase
MRLESAFRQQSDAAQAGEEHRVISRRAPEAIVASGFAAPAGAHPGMWVSSRFTAPGRSGRFWVAMWTVAVAAEFVALVPILFDDVSVVGADLVYRLVGGSFAAFGLVAWHRRPDSYSGPLMTATGFGLLVSLLLKQIHSGVALTAGEVLEDIWAPAFVALVLSFVAGGRLRSRVERIIVAGVFLAVFVLDVFSMLFVDQPDNVLLAFPSESIYGAVDAIQRGTEIVLSVAACAVIAGWWRAAPPARRRALLPSVAGAACLLMFVWLLGTDLLKGPRSQAMIMVAYSSMLVVPAAFLAGLLRSRLARGGLAQLFRELGGMRGEALQAALGRTLGDPTLVLAYRLPNSIGHADAAGQPVLVPPITSDRASAPIEREGTEVAAIVYDASLDEDPEMVEAVRAAAAMALDNERLLAESEARLAEVQASRQRIVAAGDAERRRLERDLHDGAQQRLVALSLQLRMIRSDIRRDPDQAEQLAASASDELAHSLQELRELARGIHPATLDQGLASALESLAARSTVATAVSCDVPEHVPRAVELAVYFVACEALANVGKYAEATTASVRLSRRAGGVAIEIADDGVGGADASHGSGLHGLADRVEALNGRLFVTSPPGAGTVVTAELPCAS